jgi:hypothetical protein
MNWQLSVSVVVTVVGLLSAAPQGQTRAEKITVFVVAHTRDGFVESGGVADSVRDIQSEIKKRKRLALATSEAAAEIVLRVMSRGKVAERRGAFAMPLGNGVIVGDLHDDAGVVETVMELGTYRRPIISAFSGVGGIWRECAEQISKELDKWVAANYSVLIERRKTR